VGALHKVIQSGLGVSLPRPLMRRVHETSGGNPFFGIELGRAVMRRGGEIDPADRCLFRRNCSPSSRTDSLRFQMKRAPL
jgi:hypothetical protein